MTLATTYACPACQRELLSRGAQCGACDRFGVPRTALSRLLEKLGEASRADPHDTRFKKRLSFLGRTFDQRYIIEAWIDGGGMGDVYRAHFIRFDVPVAIKVLNGAADGEAGERFAREAHTLFRLESPHTAQVIDRGEVTIDGQLSAYLVMKFVDGMSLVDRLGTEPRLTLQQTAKILDDVADSLSEAHDEHTVHRDIKPGNIMLTEGRDGALRAKVIDFGIAKSRAGTRGSADLTKTGQFIGTLTYASPEQISPLDHGEVGPAADIYSLGAVLYETLTGRPPFVGTDVEILLQHTNADTRPQPFIDDLSVEDRPQKALVAEAIQRVVFRALEKDPKRRQASALDLAREFRWAIEGYAPGRGQTERAQASDHGGQRPRLGADGGAGARPVGPEPRAHAPASTPGEVTPDPTRHSNVPAAPVLGRRSRLAKLLPVAGLVLGLGAVFALGRIGGWSESVDESGHATAIAQPPQADAFGRKASASVPAPTKPPVPSSGTLERGPPPPVTTKSSQRVRKAQEARDRPALTVPPPTRRSAPNPTRQRGQRPHSDKPSSARAAVTRGPKNAEDVRPATHTRADPSDEDNQDSRRVVGTSSQDGQRPTNAGPAAAPADATLDRDTEKAAKRYFDRCECTRGKEELGKLEARLGPASAAVRRLLRRYADCISIDGPCSR